jgi:hemoglobin
MATLYEKLGGEAAVLAAVDGFYKRVLGDPLTAPFFDETDMNAQARKQMSFMAHAFGGPDEYKGKDLREAHAHLVRDRGLTDAHFDAVASHLKATLEELNVADDLIAEVMALVGGTRGEVLDR